MAFGSTRFRMTRTDQKILFTALAFLAVVMRGKDVSSGEAAEQIRALSGLIESYCADVIGMPVAVGEDNASAIDEMIVTYIREQRDQGEMRLPEDKGTLIRVLDRLQQRKTQRIQREFYACASEDKLADLVLAFLEEEIESVGS